MLLLRLLDKVKKNGTYSWVEGEGSSSLTEGRIGTVNALFEYCIYDHDERDGLL